MKVQRAFLFIFALSIGISQYSCDIIKGVKKDLNNLIAASDNIVLLEDWTGHGCGNCPDAHREARTLADFYDSNLVVISIHSGAFASTTLFGPGFETDYTTTMGTAVDDYFMADQAGFPKGMINRRTFNGKVLQNFADWSTYIQQVLSESPQMGIDITTVYDSVTRNISITVDLEYFVNGSASDQIVVCLIEDSIVSPQKDYDSVPDKLPNYVHRHLLRDAITTGNWGEAIDAGGISAGDQFILNFNYTIPLAFDDKHCAIVAFVADDATKEIRQAAKEEVFE